MMPLPRLLLTIISMLLFAWVSHQGLRVTNEPPRLNVVATWQEENLIVTSVRPTGWAWMDGIRPGARIISIDGQPPTPVDDPNLTMARHIEVVYRGELRQTAIGTEQEDMAARFPASMMLAACFAIIGHLYFLVARNRAWGWLLFLLCGSASYAFTASIPAYIGTPLWSYDLLGLSVLLFFSACPVFFLGFPLNEFDIPECRRLAIAIGITTLIIGALYLYVVHYDQERYDTFRRVFQSFSLVNAIGACILGGAAFRRHRYARPEHAQALAIIGIGAVGGILPFCLFALLPAIIGGSYKVPPSLAINSLILFAFALLGATAHLETYYATERGAIEFRDDTIQRMQESERAKRQAAAANPDTEPPGTEE